MAAEVAIALADVEAKLGALLLQIIGYERRVADLTAENARLTAALAEARVVDVRTFPKEA